MINFEFFILILILGLIYIGFYKGDAWIVSFGGLCCVLFGIYTVASGLIDTSNWITQTIGILLTVFGLYILIRSAWELYGSKGG